MSQVKGLLEFSSPKMDGLQGEIPLKMDGLTGSSPISGNPTILYLFCDFFRFSLCVPFVLDVFIAGIDQRRCEGRFTLPHDDGVLGTAERGRTSRQLHYVPNKVCGSYVSQFQIRDPSQFGY